MNARFLSLTLLSFSIGTWLFAATETDAQRQLRDDRVRFQREVDRQRTDSQIQAERSRQSAEQQRTTDELVRLRAQQDRQSSELRALSDPARTSATATVTVPTARSAVSVSPLTTDQPPAALATATSPAITPDFSLTLLADGNCILYVKGRPPELKSPADAQAALTQLLAARQASAPSSAK